MRDAVTCEVRNYVRDPGEPSPAVAGPERLPERLRQRLRADSSARKRDPRRVGSRGPERGTRSWADPRSAVFVRICGLSGGYAPVTNRPPQCGRVAAPQRR